MILYYSSQTTVKTNVQEVKQSMHWIFQVVVSEGVHRFDSWRGVSLQIFEVSCSGQVYSSPTRHSELFSQLQRCLKDLWFLGSPLLSEFMFATQCVSSLPLNFEPFLQDIVESTKYYNHRQNDIFWNESCFQSLGSTTIYNIPFGSWKKMLHFTSVKV